MTHSTAHTVIIDGPNVAQHFVKATEGTGDQFRGLFNFDPFWVIRLVSPGAEPKFREAFPTVEDIGPVLSVSLERTWRLVHDLTSETLRMNGFILDVIDGGVVFTCVTQPVNSEAIVAAAEQLVAAALILCRQEAADFLMNILSGGKGGELPVWWASTSEVN